MEQPKRKTIRLKDYDYSNAGTYFITICIKDRKSLLWSKRRGELCSPADVPLSKIGIVVDNEIQKLNDVYPTVSVEKYCIMPDHIHMLLTIVVDMDGRTQFAPTISRIIKQFKGSITKQIGHSIWQKSFIDHIIRNERDYIEHYTYIENNPVKWELDDYIFEHKKGSFN